MTRKLLLDHNDTITDPAPSSDTIKSLLSVVAPKEMIQYSKEQTT